MQQNINIQIQISFYIYKQQNITTDIDTIYKQQNINIQIQISFHIRATEYHSVIIPFHIRATNTIQI